MVLLLASGSYTGFSVNMTDDEFKRWLCSKGFRKEGDHCVLLGKMSVPVYCYDVTVTVESLSYADTVEPHSSV